jgi:hypothetical protein
VGLSQFPFSIPFLALESPEKVRIFVNNLTELKSFFAWKLEDGFVYVFRWADKPLCLADRNMLGLASSLLGRCPTHRWSPVIRHFAQEKKVDNLAG